MLNSWKISQLWNHELICSQSFLLFSVYSYHNKICVYYSNFVEIRTVTTCMITDIVYLQITTAVITPNIFLRYSVGNRSYHKWYSSQHFHKCDIHKQNVQVWQSLTSMRHSSTEITASLAVGPNTNLAVEPETIQNVIFVLFIIFSYI